MTDAQNNTPLKQNPDFISQLLLELYGYTCWTYVHISPTDRFSLCDYCCNLNEALFYHNKTCICTNSSWSIVLSNTYNNVTLTQLDQLPIVKVKNHTYPPCSDSDLETITQESWSNTLQRNQQKGNCTRNFSSCMEREAQKLGNRSIYGDIDHLSYSLVVAVFWTHDTHSKQQHGSIFGEGRYYPYSRIGDPAFN